jgi:hypothetical protein
VTRLSGATATLDSEIGVTILPIAYRTSFGHLGANGDILMRVVILASVLAVIALPGAAASQERLVRIQADYDISVRCAGVYGASATATSMEHFEHHPDVATYRGYEQQFTLFTDWFGPELRIPKPVTEAAISDARGEAFRPVREALFAQDEVRFRSGLTALYGLIPACETERVRLVRTSGIS